MQHLKTLGRDIFQFQHSEMKCSIAPLLQREELLFPTTRVENSSSPLQQFLACLTGRADFRHDVDSASSSTASWARPVSRQELGFTHDVSLHSSQAGSVFGAQSPAGIEPLATIPVDRQTRIGSGSLSPSCGRRNEPRKEFIQLLLFGSSAGLSA